MYFQCPGWYCHHAIFDFYYTLISLFISSRSVKCFQRFHSCYRFNDFNDPYDSNNTLLLLSLSYSSFTLFDTKQGPDRFLRDFKWLQLTIQFLERSLFSISTFLLLVAFLNKVPAFDGFGCDVPPPLRLAGKP